VSRFINKALNNEDIYIYGDGSQSRTFLHVNDNISFTLKVLSNGALINDIVNVGNDKEVTVKELANIIKDMLNSKSKINYIDPLKEGDMQRRRPDIMKMIEFYKKDLISIEDGISLIMQEWNS
jgi:UDP-glucose 4-epimerase